MNRERLELLIDVLSKVPPPQFDIGTWGMHHKCGTVACALGWAALDPRMNEQGLMMFYATQDGDYPYMQQIGAEQIAALPPDTDYDVFMPGIVEDSTSQLIIPRFTGMFAAANFFDITIATTHDLFTSGGHVIKPIDVINKIEDLLQHGERDHYGPEDEDEEDEDED